ncbi:MAG: hypothetical protein A2066_21625 [Bacteroidetes bacterium GWB2_41_8]|nr:MAG: hypothetical protein A2066_21625 [Bacteroidetes bacterium GWB2_41_8]
MNVARFAVRLKSGKYTSTLVRFLNICPDYQLVEMIQFTDKEDGSMERITTVYRELSRGTQLSIF